MSVPVLIKVVWCVYIITSIRVVPHPPNFVLWKVNVVACIIKANKYLFSGYNLCDQLMW